MPRGRMFCWGWGAHCEIFQEYGVEMAEDEMNVVGGFWRGTSVRSSVPAPCRSF
jgi:hypothetical protein